MTFGSKSMGERSARVSGVGACRSTGGADRSIGSGPVRCSRGTGLAARSAIGPLVSMGGCGSKAGGISPDAARGAELANSLGGTDRVAVVAFTARLWLRQDFTTDRETLRATIRHILRGSEDQRSGSPGEPSLATALLEGDRRRATSIEKALLAIGKALDPVPGHPATPRLGTGHLEADVS